MQSDSILPQPGLPQPDGQEFSPRVRTEPPGLARIEPDELFENDPVRDSTLPKRRLARERVMQALYAHCVGGGDLDQMFLELVEPDLREVDARVAKTKEDSYGALDFARELVREWDLHHEEISGIMTARLKRWDIQRVALIDRILMEIGIVELLYFPAIPPKATINEIIEIAKDFSTEESGKFINGLLHAAMTQFSSEGKLQKSGRGLLENSPNGYRPAKGHRT